MARGNPMTAERDSYQGDGNLDRLLEAAGSRWRAEDLRGVLPGVLAAPVPPDPDHWMRLVVTAPSSALRDQLAALKAVVAEEGGDGAKAPAPASRLEALRADLESRGLDGFVVPHADEHQGEYLPPRAERLAWLTGFTGSAGAAVVLRDKAAVFVDGRYTLQAEREVDGAHYSRHHLTEAPPATWIEANLPEGATLGYDPWLHTVDQVARLRAAVEKAGGTFQPCAENPIDALWADQPAAPIAPVSAHADAFAGRGTADKRNAIAEALKERDAAAAVLSLPDSIAWLLNVRGGDVAHTPLPLSFAIVRDDATVDWFIDDRKLCPGLDTHLGNAVSVRAPDSLGSAIDALGADGKRVLVDPASAPSWVFERLEGSGAVLVKAPDPCQLPKARKNDTELEGARTAHRRDGAALTRFLAWLGETAPTRARGGADGALSEAEVAAKLLGFRRENEQFRDLSFDTISGAGPNGAVIHYRVSPDTNRALGLGELYLVDSGAQYDDGTTDVTRTVAIGEPSQEMRERFTLVLKGHIAIATARFPRGTSGSQLDALARLPLWRAGLDYDHGTGHGVGSYLGVHEGPQRVSKLPNRVALEPGMIVSNEPGYYKPGAYGIRIENLVAVIETPRRDGEDIDMLGFETLTLAPIDLALVEPALMTADEIAWLDGYHARVRDALTPLVDAETAGWLVAATRPLGG